MAEDGGGGNGGSGSPVPWILCREEEPGRRDLEPSTRPHVRRKSHELCIITCKGTLGDPAFNKSFRRILSGLNKLLNPGEERLRVRKLEPWNSVRVTFTIPGDAAQRLRALALGGDAALSRLGILSVQLDPDHVIRVGAGAIQQPPPPPPVDRDSLPLPPSSTLPGLGGTAMGSLPGLMTSSVIAGPSSSILGVSSLPGPSSGPIPGPSGIVAGPSGLTNPLMASLPGSTSSVQPVLTSPTPSSLPSPHPLPPPMPSPQPRPPPPKVFPFHSMNQAASVMRSTEQPPQPNTRQVVSGYPPPPYPSKVEGQVVSPLLVNLLQDNPSSSSTSSTAAAVNQTPPPPPPPPLPPTHQVRVKGEENSTLVSLSGGSNSFGGSAFRRLPPPYPGRIKEEVLPPPPPPPIVQPEEKKDQESTTSNRQFLINPLTGVLEPMSSEDEEEEKLVSIMDDELSLDKDSNDTMSTQCSIPASVSSNVACQQMDQHPATPIPADTTTTVPQPKEEKIKLRLKLDKEAVVSVGTVVTSDLSPSNTSPLQESITSPGYKVEMYVKRSHESNHSSSSNILPSQVQSTVPQISSTLNNNGVEVPRVPPLHISLRGRNAAVVKKDKKRDAKKARKVSGEVKRPKSSKLGIGQPQQQQSSISSASPEERSVERSEPVRSPSPVSSNDPELSGDMVPVRNYPSEAEVASILRSVVPHTTTHKLLDDSRLKRRESKKKMYPRLEYTGSKKGTKKGSGSLLKSVVKTNSKEVRMMSAVNKAIHRRDSADSTVTNSAVFGTTSLKQRSNSVPGSGTNSSAEEFRPKVNCVFGKASVATVVNDTIEPSKVVVNMCVSSGGSPTSGEAPPMTAPGQKSQTDPTKRNNEGDDSGIESMDALSEKSPNQGESPQRTTGSGVSCKSVTVTCSQSPKPDQTQTNQLSTKEDQLSASDMVSGGGGGESPVPVRLTPALYTYSNPEKLERRGGGGESLSPSSVSGDEEDHTKTTCSNSHPSPPEVDEDYSMGSSGRRNVSNKSLLEQLLIDVPGENNSNATSNPMESQSSSDLSAVTGTTGNNVRRSRPARHKTWDSHTWQTNHIDSRPSTLRVSKRKCSESGTDELGSPVSAKPIQTRNSSTPGDEPLSEEDGSVASGDLSRSSVSPAPPLQSQPPRLRHPKSDISESPHQDKNANANGSGGSSMRREVSVVLTKISRRTSVRQQKTGIIGPSVKEPSSPPVAGPPSKETPITPVTPSHRRKTRSQASDSNSEEVGSGAKRRRMSKDMK